MWVYADRDRECCVADAAAQICADWQHAALMPGGLSRHALLVRMLIRAGMLWQARADADFAVTGIDECPADDDPARALTRACAQSVCDSVAEAMANALPECPHAAIDAMLKDNRVLRARIPEGFAFYDLYPEFMIAPAKRLPKGEGTRVIGLRSIGTTLAAMAATMAETPHCATLRPHGEPFDRRVNVSAAWIADHCRADCIAIVDEGPGLSGSSFAAAGRAAIQAAGQDAVVFLPTHGGDPGIAAMARDRAAWRVARKEIADRTLFDDGPFARVHWFEDLIGIPVRVTDFGGGLWRKNVFDDIAHWPAVDPMQERVKLHIETENGPWLLKFSGLTPLSDQNFERAKEFSEAGFGVMPSAERHGMTLWPWCDGSRPLTADDRRETLPFIADMLAFRAQSWATSAQGASVQQLYAMASHNLAEGIGADAVQMVAPWRGQLDRLARWARPVRIDGRLDPHEFLRRPNGSIVKTDALDHHAAHDLIGCQDILWDVGGTMVEWCLSVAEGEFLLDRLEQAYGRIAREALPFYRIAYLSFRLGGAVMAMEALSETDAAESQRFRRRAEFYRAQCQALMQEGERA